MPQVVNALEGRDVLTDQPSSILSRPAASLDLTPRKAGFREAPLGEQLLESKETLDAKLSDGEGVESEQMVTTLQGIATEPIEIQPGAAGHQNALTTRSAVVETLEVIAPPAVLVNLVEDPERRWRQLAPEDPFPILRDVPAEIAGCGTGQTLGQRRLADLTRSRDEHHLLGEISTDLGLEVSAAGRHQTQELPLFSTTVKITNGDFPP